MTFDLAYWAKARNTSPFYRCNFENYVSDVDAINSATNVIMKFSGYATKVLYLLAERGNAFTNAVARFIMQNIF